MATFVVGAAIVDSLARPTRLLAAQRSYPKDLAGRWEFPGGKMEPGETPEQALHREIGEELGATLTLGSLVRLGDPQTTGESSDPNATGQPSDPNATGESRETDWPIPVGHMRVWLAQIAPGSPAPRAGSSHRELRWVSADEVPYLSWLDGDHQIIPALLAHFPTNLP